MAEWIEAPAEYDHAQSLRDNRLRSRGVLRCGCGAGVDLRPAMYAPDYAARCDGCGQLFNLSGQQLCPRDQWEES